ncbi:MAG: hypothetical protein CMF62_02810 [Magnetococcales bacterium]|nr:hypothetical protein [Magnetococcales bacterium]|tara:strand:+ start:21913 stop:22365 length:453 start_codon:yes stop_codon:yes gene_type:complete
MSENKVAETVQKVAETVTSASAKVSEDTITILGQTLSRNTVYMLAAVLVLVIGYFVYKWYFAKDKNVPSEMDNYDQYNQQPVMHDNMPMTDAQLQHMQQMQQLQQMQQMQQMQHMQQNKQQNVQEYEPQENEQELEEMPVENEQVQQTAE